LLKYVKKIRRKLLDFYFANRREQFVLPAPWCASFRHEGNYNGGDAAAGSPPCIGRENGRVDSDFPMRCPSVGSGTANQTQSATQLTTRRFAAAHIMRRSAFDTKPHPINILPQSMKRLFH
jgi:hypothetical protein